MRSIRVIPVLLVAQVLSTACVSDEYSSDGPLDRTNYVDLADLRNAGAIEQRLRHVLRDHEGELELVIRNGTVHRDGFVLPEGDTLTDNLLVVRGDAEVRGTLIGNLVAIDGAPVLHPGSAVSGEVLIFNGKVQHEGSEIGGDVRMFGKPIAAPETQVPWRKQLQLGSAVLLAVAVASFLLLLLLGAGVVTFVPRHLEIAADTVSHSLGRSFLVGFVGQILLAPAFGVLVVGLIVSGIGILLLPFAVVAYILLSFGGTVGGYLAVVHAMGKTYLRRHLSAGSAEPPSDDRPLDAPGGYRPLLVGLGMLAFFTLVCIGIGWLLLSWGWLAAFLLWLVLALVHWFITTTGFGAILLSRGGTRANFAGGQ